MDVPKGLLWQLYAMVTLRLSHFLCDMKDTYFFYHDYGARNDPKLQEVLMELGPAGIGIYWCLVEMLYEQGGTLPLASVKSIAYSLHTDRDTVMRVISDFGLFETTMAADESQEFRSPAVVNRLEERRAMLEKKSAAGKKGMSSRWGKKKAELSQSDNGVITELSQSDNMDIAVLSECDNNKVNNKKEEEIKINSSSTADAEKEEFLSIFFFEKNLATAKYELNRFVDYYQGRSWTFKEGLPVGDRMAVCRQWNPKDTTKRFKHPKALQFLHDVWKAARRNSEPGTLLLMTEVDAMESREEGNVLHLFYRGSQAARELIHKYLNGLAGIELHLIEKK